MRWVVSVIGGAVISPDVEQMAFEVGCELGQRGLSLVCGGRGGVMTAASRGLRHARDTGVAKGEPVAIGLLPELDWSAANPYLDVALPTGLGLARNAVVVSAGLCAIAISGGAGTLCEMTFTSQFARPLCALKPSGGWAGEMAGRALDPRHPDVLVAPATSAKEAADWALRTCREVAPTIE